MTETSSDGNTIAHESGWTSVWSSQDLEPITVAFFLVMLLGVMGLLGGAILHGRWRSSAGRPLLWACAITLLLGSLLGMFTVGVFLLPGAILGLAAAALAGSPHERDGDPMPQAG